MQSIDATKDAGDKRLGRLESRLWEQEAKMDDVLERLKLLDSEMEERKKLMDELVHEAKQRTKVLTEGERLLNGEVLPD